MSENWTTEDAFEAFEGDLRKLDELIAQLEVWSDMYTINHKKEQARLEEYVELSKNLYELQTRLYDTIGDYTTLGITKEQATGYRTKVEEKFANFKEIEIIIHDWIRNVENIRLLLMRSPILNEHRASIQKIIEV